MWRKLFDVLFWLGVSLYFGGMVAVAAAAPAIFGIAEKAKLSMPGLAVPPLEMDRQVGGEVFGAVLNQFASIESTALALMLIAVLGWIFSSRFVRRSTWLIAALWVLLAALLMYDTFGVRSRVWLMREEVRKTAAAHVADAKETWPSKWPEWVTFDALHKRSESLGHWKVYVLFAMLVTAAWRGAAEKKTARGFRRMGVMTPRQ